MALALTFEQSNNGKTLTITDASDAGTVYTGQSISIVLYGSGNTASTKIPAFTAIGDTVEVTAVDVGQTADTAFTDGIYTIIYTTDAEITGATYNVLLDYSVKYCVYNMYRELPSTYLASPALCTNKEVERVRFMGTFLKSLEYSAACGQTNEILTILATLQNLCLNPGINECYCN